MKSVLRRNLVSGAAALTVAVVGWGAAGAQDREPEARMSRGLVAAACAFERFMQGAAGVDAAFADRAAVDHAVDVAVAYDPQQLETGMIAFAAMTALQEPAFVAGVRQAVEEAGSPEAFAQKLAEDPDLALRLPGAQAAAARASGALAREAEPLVSAGGRIRQAAYDVQRQDWSRAWTAEPGGRLARAKAVSAPQSDPATPDTTRLFQAILRVPGDALPTAADPLAAARTPVQRGALPPAASPFADDEAAWGMTERARAGGPPLAGGPREARRFADADDDDADVQDLRAPGAAPAFDPEARRREFAGLRQAQAEVRAAEASSSPVIARALALAAEALVGRAGEAHEAGLKTLISEGRSADCLRMAKLNTYQCLAVAGPEYENIFCLGEHAMAEAGRCIAEASGAASHVPATADVALPVAAAPASRDVGVPVSRGDIH